MSSTPKFSLFNPQSLSLSQSQLITLLLHHHTNSNVPKVSPRLIASLCDNDAETLIRVQKTLVFREDANLVVLPPQRDEASTNLFPLRSILTVQQRHTLDALYYTLEGKYPEEFSDFTLRDHAHMAQERLDAAMREAVQLEGWNRTLYAWDAPNEMATSSQAHKRVASQEEKRQATASQDSLSKRSKRKREILEKRGEKVSSQQDSEPAEKRRKIDITVQQENLPQELVGRVEKMQNKLSTLKDKEIFTFLQGNATHLAYILAQLDMASLPDTTFGKISREMIKRETSYEHARVFIQYTWLKKLQQYPNRSVSRFILQSLQSMATEHPQAVLDGLLTPLYTTSSLEKPHNPGGKQLTATIEKVVVTLPSQYIAAFLTFLIDELPHLEWDESLFKLLKALIRHKSRPLSPANVGTLVVHVQNPQKEDSLTQNNIDELLLSLILTHPEIMKPHVSLLEKMKTANTKPSLVTEIQKLKDSV